MYKFKTFLFPSCDTESSQSLGEMKTGDLRENPSDHSQGELGLSVVINYFFSSKL